MHDNFSLKVVNNIIMFIELFSFQKPLFKMFTLLSGLWKYLFQKEEYYVLILGLDNAGKTVSACNFLNENIGLQKK